MQKAREKFENKDEQMRRLDSMSLNLASLDKMNNFLDMTVENNGNNFTSCSVLPLKLPTLS